jgi:hypothetical protein
MAISELDRAAAPVTEASYPELFGRLLNDVSELADRHIELSKQEIDEEKTEVIGTAKKLAISAGVLAAAGLLLVIWLWSGFIWLFNWLGGLLLDPAGGVAAGIGNSLGWILGLLLPVLAAAVAGYVLRAALAHLKEYWPPLPRTRAALKEDLEWVRRQRTPSAA